MAIDVLEFAWEEFRGDTIKYDLACARDGVAINMTGGDIWFTARNSNDAVIINCNTIDGGIAYTNRAGGLARLTITSALTEAIAVTDFGTDGTIMLDCDVQIQEANNDVETIGKGTLTIYLDETRTRRGL